VLKALVKIAPSLAILSILGVEASSLNRSLYAEIALVAWSSESIKIILGLLEDLSMFWQYTKQEQDK